MTAPPQTFIGIVDSGLIAGRSIDQIRAAVARAHPEVTAAEVERAARMLRECGPADPDPLTDSEIQAINDEIGALPDPRDGWPRVGTSDVIDRPTALQQVAAAAVVARHATSGTDLDDLVGALGIGHALEVAVRAEQPAAGICRCAEIAAATLARPAEWEQADDCPVHPIEEDIARGRCPVVAP